MLKYVTILLDEAAPSFCHYEPRKESRLMEIETLKQAIFWAMKENLMIQFVYPDGDLPQEYLDVIETIDHFNICSDRNTQVQPNVQIVETGRAPVSTPTVPSGDETGTRPVSTPTVPSGDETGTRPVSTVLVVRWTKEELFARYAEIPALLSLTPKLNVVITDVETMKEEDFAQYKQLLSALATEVEKLYVSGHSPQLNLLTDRMLLENPNHCNAGWESITVGADGRLRVCPGFEETVGDVWSGLDLRNPQLYRQDHAPICRVCDAWQCRRCVLLNRRTTYEVNTPSHEQCVAAHLERNASRDLLLSLRQRGEFLPDREIKEINYLDPFDEVNQWK